MRQLEQADSELLERWAKGEREAAETLIRKYYGHAYALCLGHCQGNIEKASDAVQLFFGRLTKALPFLHTENPAKFHSIKNNFLAYMAVGLRNNAKEQHRVATQRNAKVFPISKLPLDKTGLAPISETFERNDRIKYVLSLLPESQRQIYQLYLAGYSYAEIALQTGLNKDQVRGRIDRGNNTLKKHRSLIKQLLLH